MYIFGTDKSAINRKFISLNSIQDRVPKCLTPLDFKIDTTSTSSLARELRGTYFAKNKYTLPLQSSRNQLFKLSRLFGEFFVANYFSQFNNVDVHNLNYTKTDLLNCTFRNSLDKSI